MSIYRAAEAEPSLLYSPQVVQEKRRPYFLKAFEARLISFQTVALDISSAVDVEVIARMANHHPQ
jgi:hypothetical protein